MSTPIVLREFECVRALFSFCKFQLSSASGHSQNAFRDGCVFQAMS